jgi:hypothetical protein
MVQPGARICACIVALEGGFDKLCKLVACFCGFVCYCGERVRDFAACETHASCSTLQKLLGKVCTLTELHSSKEIRNNQAHSS